MLVVDSSALLNAIVARDPLLGLVERISSDGDLHAPHLVDIEVLHALRRLTGRGELTEDRASDARTDFSQLAIVRYPHVGLSDRIWELRHNLTAYDAAYVALAEVLNVPLITSDQPLSQSSGHTARIELFSGP